MSGVVCFKKGVSGVLPIMLGQCSIPAGAAGYPYIQHLMEFERRTGIAPAPGRLQSVGTPLLLGEWSKELEGHPDAKIYPKRDPAWF